MDPTKFLEIQQQARRNQEELQAYMRELGDWEDEIKKKDEKLKTSGPAEKKVSVFL